MKKMFLRLRPFVWLVLFAGVFIIGSSFANLKMPALLGDVINNGVALGDSAYVLSAGMQMLKVAVLSILCAIGTAFCSSRIATGFGAGLREDIFTKVQTFSSGEVDSFGAASLITRTTNDVMQMQNFVMMLIRTVLSAPVTALGGVYMAFSRSSSLASVLLLAMPLIVCIVVVVSKLTIPMTKLMQKRLDEVNLVLREKLRGIRVIRAFNNDAYERKRFSAANRTLTDSAIRMQLTMGAMFPLVMLILNSITILIIWIGARSVDAGIMGVGDIMTVVEYVMQILMSMMMVSMIFIRIPRAVASADRINAILEQDTDILDGKVTDSSDLRGELCFENVTFAYAGAEEPAVKDLTFTVHRGQTVAIIGSTGSGKSTLLGLIPRLYDPQDGTITLDGIPLREYELHTLRSKIGYVNQKAVLFAGTIAENIALGKKDATQQEIAAAAEIAQAEAFILEKPEAFQAEISQGGTNVSGGQKQRLSIARAVVRRPEFYLFDDSFSALDFKTDYQLRKALREATGDSTVLIVAQRVSTIMDADLILVLEEGRIVGQGTHSQLLQSCAVYREIVYSQLSEEEAAI